MLRSVEDHAIVYRPNDYFSDAPERMGGDEFELRPTANIRVSDIEEEHCEALGIETFKRGEHLWLSNGSKVHKEFHDHIEVCTPETRGPLDGTAAHIASLRTFRALLTLAHPVPTDEEKRPLVRGLGTVYYHAGSEVKGKRTRRGFHSTMMAPDGIIDHRYIRNVVDTHMAVSGIWEGAGILTQDGFRILQKEEIGDGKSKPQQIAMMTKGCRGETDVVNEGWSRIERRVFDATRSAHAIFLSKATGSLVLRMFEHAGKLSKENRKLLRDAALAHPLGSLPLISEDLTLRRPLECSDGKYRTSLEIGRTYASIAGDLAQEVKLPGTESMAIDMWHRTLDILEHTHPDVGDVEQAAEIIHWAYRMRRLQRKNDKEVAAWNSSDARLQSLSLGLDMIYPIDPLEAFVARTATGLIPEGLISYLETMPPNDTRAAARSQLIHDYKYRLEFINWNASSVRGYGHVGLHPFDPKPHFYQVEPS